MSFEANGDPADGVSAADLKASRKRRAASATPAARVDRSPPHSSEAEQGVLGCCLRSPAECVPLVLARLKGGSEAFYDLRHQVVWEEVSAMHDALLAVDVITLSQRLKDRRLLEQVGGTQYLMSLEDCVPSAANLGNYLEILSDKWLLRETIKACTETVGRAYDFEGEVDQLLDDAERDILRVTGLRADSASQKDVKELVHSAIGKVEEYFSRMKGALGGLATGFADLDRMTDGLHGSEVTVIAGRPGTGKTSLLMNMVEEACVRGGTPTAVFTLEMSAESLVLRTLCCMARVNLRNIREGFMSEADFPKLTAAAGKLARAPLFVEDHSSLSVTALRARARRLHSASGVRLFGVDYLQLLHSTSRRAKESRQNEVADISAGLKALAKELDVPVVVLSQLNRQLERDKHRKPKLADLRESGSIEQDADTVGLLYKPASDEEESGGDEPDGVAVNLCVAKQRNGPTGDVALTFLKPYTRFESAARVAEDDVP